MPCWYRGAAKAVVNDVVDRVYITVSADQIPGRGFQRLCLRNSGNTLYSITIFDKIFGKQLLGTKHH